MGPPASLIDTLIRADATRDQIAAVGHAQYPEIASTIDALCATGASAAMLADVDSLERGAAAREAARRERPIQRTVCSRTNSSDARASVSAQFIIQEENDIGGLTRHHAFCRNGKAYHEAGRQPTSVDAERIIAALGYAGRSWPVLPIIARDGKKRPLTSHGPSDATRDRDVILSWWIRWPAGLIANATGELSGIVALDIDETDSMNGWDTSGVLGHPFALETAAGRNALYLRMAWPLSENNGGPARPRPRYSR